MRLQQLQRKLGDDQSKRRLANIIFKNYLHASPNYPTLPVASLQRVCHPCRGCNMHQWNSHPVTAIAVHPQWGAWVRGVWACVFSNRRLFAFRVLLKRHIVNSVRVCIHHPQAFRVMRMRYDSHRLKRWATKCERTFSTTCDGQRVLVHSRYTSDQAVRIIVGCS